MYRFSEKKQFIFLFFRVFLEIFHEFEKCCCDFAEFVYNDSVWIEEPRTGASGRLPRGGKEFDA
ncbi:MAG: hypothetical protein IKN72_00680 [Clostridia bacterium]|nr:hypothetical protein [Clostridia bacterium]